MRVTKPMELLLDTGKVTSNVPLPTISGDGIDPDEWDTSATYAEGDQVYVASTSKIYQNIYESATDNTVSSPEINVLEAVPKWSEVSYVNKWKMFDLTRNTTTYSANGTTNITITLTPRKVVSSVAILGMVGVTDILITGTINDGTPAYNIPSTHYTGSSIRNYVVYDLTPSISLVLTIVLAGPASVGCTHIVLGSPEILGDLQADIVRDSVNFSTVDRDTYGTATLVKRKSVPKVTYTVNALASNIERILVVRDDLNAQVALWSGLEDTTDGYYDALLILGFYRSFFITLDNYISSTIALELEELSTGYAPYVSLPPLTQYVLDTFSTDGTLASRSGETGTSWSTGTSYSANKATSDAIVSGGKFYLPAAGSSNNTTYFASGLIPATVDFYAEVEFLVPTGYAGKPQVSIVLSTNPNGSNDWVTAYSQAEPSFNDFALGASRTIGGSFSNLGTIYDTPFAADTVKILRIEFSASRATIKRYFNGVLKDTDNTQPALGACYMGIEIYNSTSSGYRSLDVLRVEAGPL
jgi:hypothetical protein